MNSGTLYGIGVGPGDPELMTVRAATLLAGISRVFVPQATDCGESLALNIASQYLNKDAIIERLTFSMSHDPDVLVGNWDTSSRRIIEILDQGMDGCFLTLGDPLLYSTYIYLARAIRRLRPSANLITVPGVNAFSAVAALAEFPVGEGKNPVTIIPATDDLTAVRQALCSGGCLVIMKIGKRLHAVLDLLEEAAALERAVFVSHAGQSAEKIETDLTRLRGHPPEPNAGYLSTILVRAKG